jgi:colanic acid biosynthesis glycosyl transferase WcaI
MSTQIQTVHERGAAPPVATQAAGRDRLRIAFVSCLFPPEPEPSAVMASQLARSLASHGHEVTMIVPFPNRPGGVLYPGYHRTLRLSEDIGRVRVVRCPTLLIGPARRIPGRIMENLSFGVSSALIAALEPRPDVLLLESWPLGATQLCVWQAEMRGVPLVYYVKDLYPETLETSGIIARGGFLARSLRRWDRRLCLASRKVVAISQTMRDSLVQTRGLPPDRVAVIPDWIDEDEFRPHARDNAWRLEKGLSGETFVALYAGTLGIVSGADLLVEVADRLRNQPEILLLCVGQGVLKERMEAEAKARRLTNIRFEPFQPRDRVPEMQAAADVCLLTMRPGSNASVPSKLISYMAAGRPVICAAPPDTDVSAEVRAAAAGLLVSPGDPGALAAAIRHIRNHPEDASVMVANARRFFEEKLAFRNRYGQFFEVLAEAAGPPRTAGPVAPRLARRG